MFDDIIGNDRVKKSLTRMVDRNMIGQSFLFAGPQGIGKSLFANALALHIVGEQTKNHPDIRIYRPEGKIGMHSIDSMRQFNQDVYLAPLESKKKVFILHDADRMLSTSANALLKTFEEPADDAVIILLSSNPENLLTTVLSRCRRVFFQPVESELIINWLVERKSIDRALAEQVVPFAGGSVGEALRLCEHGQDELREVILNLLSDGRHSFRDIQRFSSQVSKHLEELKNEIEAAAREEIIKMDKKAMTAVQREHLEKEINGVVSLHFQAEVDRVLQVIISWYRDLHLLQSGGARDLLINRDHSDKMAEHQRRQVRPLDQIQDLVANTRLAIQRFAPVQSSLETLFLQLS